MRIRAVSMSVLVLAAVSLMVNISEGGGMGKVRHVDMGGTLSMELVWIPPGEFMMGSPEDESEHRRDEVPQHRVIITHGFWMGKYEVTQAQWRVVMGNNPSCFSGDERPVEQVSWDDCQEFISRLNARVLEGGFRLPTEAEWEYACRAGTTSAFHMGDAISTKRANFNGNAVYGLGSKGIYRKETTPVGSFSANDLGLYDMHGNVFEWCQDKYCIYSNDAAIDPKGSEAGVFRVYRGGSWSRCPGNCRAAYRGGSMPDTRRSNLGFRVVLSQLSEPEIVDMPPSKIASIKR